MGGYMIIRLLFGIALMFQYGPIHTKKLTFGYRKIPNHVKHNRLKAISRGSGILKVCCYRDIY